MTKLKVVGQSKVGTLRKVFRESMGVDILIYDGQGDPADEQTTLGRIRTKKPESTEIEIVGQTKVQNVERYFHDNYGVSIDLLEPDGTPASDDLTLGELRRRYGSTDEVRSDVDQESHTSVHETVSNSDRRERVRAEERLEATVRGRVLLEEGGEEVLEFEIPVAIDAGDDPEAIRGARLDEIYEVAVENQTIRERLRTLICDTPIDRDRNPIVVFTQIGSVDLTALYEYKYQNDDSRAPEVLRLLDCENEDAEDYVDEFFNNFMYSVEFICQ